MGVDQEGDFGVEVAERGVRGERHLHDISHAAHVDEHLVRSLFGEPSAKLANHRSPVLPLFLRPSTRTEEPRTRPANGGAQEAAVEDFAGWYCPGTERIEIARRFHILMVAARMVR